MIEELKITIEESSKDYTYVSLFGNFSIATMSTFKNSLLGDAFRKKDIKISIKDVTALDSSGIGALITLKKLQEKSGKSVILIDEMQNEIREILTTLSFDKYFTLEKRDDRDNK